MKILSIAGQNIASLKDQFFVEFYNGPLKDAGLFSISGKTGAGKSSLFDAMCLALFAETPRLNSNSRKILLNNEDGEEQSIFYCKFDLNDPLQIITRGETHAYAEVYFEVKNCCYKARWEVTKKRKNLEHVQRLFEIKEDKSEIEFIADTHTQKNKQKLTLAKIESIIGLSFEQFKRAVLLAQGEFAQFLKSNPDEKVLLLEKITGSEIYTFIAKQAHEEFNKIKIKKEELEQKKNAIHIKTEEELREISFLIDEIHEKNSAVKDSQKKWEEQKAWYEKEKTFSQEIATYEAQISKIFLDEENINEKEFLLNKVKKAESLKTTFHQIKEQENEINFQKNELVQEKNTFLCLQNKIDSIKKTEILHRKSLDLFLSEKQNIEDCIAACERLDTKKEGLTQSLEKEQTNLTFQQNEIKNAKNILNESEEKINKNTLAMKELEFWLQENSYLEKVKSNKNSIFDYADKMTEKHKEIEKYKNILNFNKPLSLTKEELDHTLKNAKESHNKLITELNKILQDDEIENSDTEISQLQEKIKILERIEEDQKYGLEIQNELITAEKEFYEITQNLSLEEEKLKLIDDAIEKQSQELSILNEDVTKISAAADVASKRYLLLKRGEECPLCGSLEHPLANAPSVFDETLQKLSEEKSIREAQLKKDANIKKKIEITKIELIKNFSTQEQKLKSLKTNLEKCLRSTHNNINNLNENSLNITGEIKNFNNLNTEIFFTKYTNQLNSRKEKIKRKLELEVAQRNYSEQEFKYKEIIKSLEIMLHCENFIKENISHKKYSLENILKFKENFKENINKIICTSEEKNTLFQQLKTDQNTLNIERASVRSGMVEKEKQKDQLKVTIDNIQKELENCIFQRKSILSAEDTKIYKKQIREKEFGLTTHLNEITEELQGEEKKLAHCNTTILFLEDKLKNAEANLQQNKTEYLEKLKRIGFDNEEQVLPFFEYDEKWMQQAEKSINEFRNKFSEFNTLLNKAKIDYHEHTSKRQAQLTYEEIKEKIFTSNTENEENQRKIGEYRQTLSFDFQQKKMREELDNLLNEIEPSYKTWEKMTKVLGPATGRKSFRTFAQNITLDILLSRANYHLSELRPRYKLETIPNADMEIRIVDLFMGNELRSINSLSGGESFLVSLALALALSSLSSKNIHIGSLFIDEGFGSLDADTLETAISILDSLQSQGRKVGIISHVESLSEKIGYKIMVKEKGGGCSQIVVE